MQLNLQNSGASLTQGFSRGMSMVNANKQAKLKEKQLEAAQKKQEKDAGVSKLAEMRRVIDQIKDPTAKANFINNKYNVAFKDVYGVDAPSVLDLDKESQKISLEISDIYSNIDAGMLSKEAGKADIEALQRRGNMLGMKDLGARQAGDRQASAADDYRALLEERRQAGADIDDAAKADFAKRGLSIKSRMGEGDADRVLGTEKAEQELLGSNASESSSLLGTEEHAVSTASIVDDIAVLMASDDPEKKQLGESMAAIKRKSSGELREDRLFNVLVKDLPSLQATAFEAQRSLQSITTAMDLIENRDVTGVSGTVKAKFAAAFQSFGFSPVMVQSASDAEYYKLLARSLVGPLRLELIGTGPVSDFEQKILKDLSGGGTVTKSSALRLMKDFEARSKTKVNIYNTTVKAASKLSPSVADTFEIVDFKKKEDSSEKEADSILKGLGL